MGADASGFAAAVERSAKTPLYGELCRLVDVANQIASTMGECLCAGNCCGTIFAARYRQQAAPRAAHCTSTFWCSFYPDISDGTIVVMTHAL